MYNKSSIFFGTMLQTLIVTDHNFYNCCVHKRYAEQDGNKSGRTTVIKAAAKPILVQQFDILDHVSLRISNHSSNHFLKTPDQYTTVNMNIKDSPIHSIKHSAYKHQRQCLVQHNHCESYNLKSKQVAIM